VVRRRRNLASSRAVIGGMSSIVGTGLWEKLCSIHGLVFHEMRTINYVERRLVGGVKRLYEYRARSRKLARCSRGVDSAAGEWASLGRRTSSAREV